LIPSSRAASLHSNATDDTLIDLSKICTKVRVLTVPITVDAPLVSFSNHCPDLAELDLVDVYVYTS
jgi:hypothetical protein